MFLPFEIVVISHIIVIGVALRFLYVLINKNFSNNFNGISINFKASFMINDWKHIGDLTRNIYKFVVLLILWSVYVCFLTLKLRLSDQRSDADLFTFIVPK